MRRKRIIYTGDEPRPVNNAEKEERIKIETELWGGPLVREDYMWDPTSTEPRVVKCMVYPKKVFWIDANGHSHSLPQNEIVFSSPATRAPTPHPPTRPTSADPPRGRNQGGIQRWHRRDATYTGAGMYSGKQRTITDYSQYNCYTGFGGEVSLPVDVYNLIQTYKRIMGKDKYKRTMVQHMKLRRAIENKLRRILGNKFKPLPHTY